MEYKPVPREVSAAGYPSVGITPDGKMTRVREGVVAELVRIPEAFKVSRKSVAFCPGE